MVREGQVFHRDGAVLVRNDPASRRQIGCAEARVGVGEAFHVVQFAVGGRVVVDGVSGRQILLILRDGAVFDVDRKGKRGHARMSHCPIDLGDAVVFEPIKRVRAVDDEFGAQGVPVVLHRQGVFSVRFLEAARTTMDGDHAELFLCPLLRVGITELNGDFTRTLDEDGTAGLLSVDVDGQVGGEAGELFWPSGGVVKRSAEQLTRIHVVGYGRLIVLVLVHDVFSCRQCEIATEYTRRC